MPNERKMKGIFGAQEIELWLKSPSRKDWQRLPNSEPAYDAEGDSEG